MRRARVRSRGRACLPQYVPVALRPLFANVAGLLWSTYLALGARAAALPPPPPRAKAS